MVQICELTRIFPQIQCIYYIHVLLRLLASSSSDTSSTPNPSLQIIYTYSTVLYYRCLTAFDALRVMKINCVVLSSQKLSPTLLCYHFTRAVLMLHIGANVWVTESKGSLWDFYCPFRDATGSKH